MNTKLVENGESHLAQIFIRIRCTVLRTSLKIRTIPQEHRNAILIPYTANKCFKDTAC